MLTKIFGKDIIDLIRIMKDKKLPYLISIIGYALLCAVGLNITIAFVLRELVSAVTNKNFDLLYPAVKLLSISLLIVIIVGPILYFVCNKSIKVCINNLRSELFKHIENLPLKFFNKTNIGDLLSYISNDLNTIEQIYFEPIFMLIFCVFLGFGSAISMFILDWRMAIAILLISVIYMVVNSMFSKKIRKYSDEILKNYSEVTRVFNILLNSVFLMKVFYVKDILIKKFDTENGKLASSRIRRLRVEGFQDSANFLLNMINFIGIVIVMAFFTLKGNNNFSNSVAFIELQAGINFCFLQFGGFVAQIQSSLAGVKRVVNIFKYPVESNQFKDNNTNIIHTDDFIKIRDVKFSYDGDNEVLCGLNLSAKEKQNIALVGESGSGKTTIFKLILGLLQSQHGEITIANKSIEEYTIDQLRNLISYVPQNVYLFNETIYNNIKFGNLNASDEEIINAAKMANAHDFIMDLPGKYEYIVGEKGGKLSEGQKQRIAIARAFLRNSPILLMDEATAGLDSESSLKIMNSMEQLIKNKTTIIIAHRISSLKNSDLIYVINKGRVVEQGTYKDLLEKSSAFSEMCRLQMQ